MHQVYYNRSMLLAALLPMLLIVVSSVYLILDGAGVARERFLFGILSDSYFFYPIISIIAITFSQYAAKPLYKLLRKKPALRWGKAGITLANGSRVAWVAIQSIQMQQHKNQCHILIFLDEPLAFIDMQYKYRQVDARQHWKRFQTPVAIYCNELDIDAQILLKALQSLHQKNHL